MSKEWQRQTQKGNSSFEGSDIVENLHGSGSTSEGQTYLDGDGDEIEDNCSVSSDDETGFFVKVETIMGNVFQVYVYPSDSVELLKTRIAFQEGIPQKDQNLFLGRGKLALNDSNLLLSDLGLNESNAKSRPFRLITSVTTGVGSKGFVTRETSPPPPLMSSTPSSIPLPFIPTPFSSFKSNNVRDPSQDQNSARRSQRNQGMCSSSLEERHLRLPQLHGLTEEMNDINGLFVFRDRNDQKVFVFVKKSAVPPRTVRRMNSRDLFRIQSAEKRTDDFGGRDTIEAPKQLERIRENAKTLQKMNDIRTTLLSRKKQSTTANTDQLPDINLNRNSIFSRSNVPENPLSFLHPEPTPRSVSTSTMTNNNSTDSNRTITSSVASLNRLKAEIYLEAKRIGGGSCGVLPYTNIQLCRYVQLKVKVLLADQNPKDFDSLIHRFVRSPVPQMLTPTVVQKREQSSCEKVTKDSNKGKVREKRDSSTSTSASISSKVFKDLSSRENTERSRNSTALNRKSEDSIKSGRLNRRKHLHVTGNYSGVGGIRLDSETLNLLSIKSGGRRQTSGSSNGQLLGPVMKTNSDEKKSSKTSIGSDHASEAALHSTQSTSASIKKNKEAVVRCQECRKRIGVACRYQCRCGKVFCSTHRYAEVHKCTFDYKTEGRKQLQEANPLIVPNKVDKI